VCVLDAATQYSARALVVNILFIYIFYVCVCVCARARAHFESIIVLLYFRTRDTVIGVAMKYGRVSRCGVKPTRGGGDDDR
jgi:hypothetical protein